MKTLNVQLKLDGTLPKIDLPQDQHVKIVVHPPGVHILELASISFASNRQVLLPDSESRPEDESCPARISSIDVFVEAFRFLEAHPRKQVLIVGHTDTLGSDADNEALSLERAENVRLFLSGDREAWGEHSLAHAEVADLQRALAWVDGLSTDFACHPGIVDNEMGPQTRGALHGFRDAFESLFGEALGDSDAPTAEDWSAFARLYTAAIDEANSDPGFSNRVLSSINFAGPGAIGLGERHPTENPEQDGLDSERNRRVELIFLDPAEAEFLSDPATCERYLYEKANSIERTWLPVGLACRPDEMVVRLLRENGTPVPSVVCRATTATGEVVEASTNGDGVAVFRALPRGTCEVRLEGLEAADWEAEFDEPRTLPPPPPPEEEPDDDIDLFDVPPMTDAERSVFDLGD